jgi:hypothetical protein
MTTDSKWELRAQAVPIEVLKALFEELGSLAAGHRQHVEQRRTEARRVRKGTTLRPGEDTPLWSAIVQKMRPHLRVRGCKAGLARALGVPRQRVHDYFVAGTQMPDAERLLHILLWLAARETERLAEKIPTDSR